MLKKLTQFTLLTYVITMVTWGLCAVISQYGILLSNQPALYVPYIIGGLSPTIASYIVLKKNGEVTGFRQWLWNVFDFRATIVSYLFVVFIVSALFILKIQIFGLKEMLPFYLFFVLLPVILIGGGLEEAGWRYILQPELDKKYGYILSSLIVTVIWALWHLPLFYIPGVTQYGMSFLTFSISICAITFMMGAIYRLSGKVFPCVLAHCMINSGLGVFITNDTLTGTFAVTGIIIVLSVGAVHIHTLNTAKKTKI